MLNYLEKLVLSFKRWILDEPILLCLYFVKSLILVSIIFPYNFIRAKIKAVRLSVSSCSLLFTALPQ